MDNFYIQKSIDSPEISLNFAEQKFSFEGKSLPENPEEFYQPVINLIQNFVTTNPTKLVVDFKFEYFNTASSKKILDILDILDKNLENKNLNINWYYKTSDEDIREAGEDMQDLTSLTFNFKEV